MSANEFTVVDVTLLYVAIISCEGEGEMCGIIQNGVRR